MSLKKLLKQRASNGKAMVGMDDKALFLAYVVGMTLWAVVIGVLAFGLLGCY